MVGPQSRAGLDPAIHFTTAEWIVVCPSTVFSSSALLTIHLVADFVLLPPADDWAFPMWPVISGFWLWCLGRCPANSHGFPQESAAWQSPGMCLQHPWSPVSAGGSAPELRHHRQVYIPYFILYNYYLQSFLIFFLIICFFSSQIDQISNFLCS